MNDVHGGSVIGMTDEDGDEVARYTYDPYGGLVAISGETLAKRNPLRYRGYYYDNETQLYYLPARYYNPDTARFLSVDPAPPSAGDPTTLNAYLYCFGDPVQFFDPTGAFGDFSGDGKLNSTDYYAKDYLDDPTDENEAAAVAAYLVDGAGGSPGQVASSGQDAKMRIVQGATVADAVMGAAIDAMRGHGPLVTVGSTQDSNCHSVSNGMSNEEILLTVLGPSNWGYALFGGGLALGAMAFTATGPVIVVTGSTLGTTASPALLTVGGAYVCAGVFMVVGGTLIAIDRFIWSPFVEERYGQ